MKRILFVTALFVACVSIVAQVPDPPFNPMTAPGARGISRLIHTLYWQNPNNVVYNEVYFSSDSVLVANLDVSVKVKNGYPDSIFSSYSVSELGYLTENKYFWRVIEYNAEGLSTSPLWYFKTFIQPEFEYHYTFDTGLDSWEILGPLGLNNWYWTNSTHTLSTPGEVAFRWDPVFIGDSYLISPEINAQSGAEAVLRFNYYEDWWSDTVVVGCAITTDNGLNWSPIWDLHATGNVGPELVVTNVNTADKFRLGFYYKGNSNNIDFLYVDDISLEAVVPLTPSYPPGLLTSFASETEQKVTLNWSSGWAPAGMVGYEVQRKVGLPSFNPDYVTIAMTDLNTFSFDDLNVELDQDYTYRIRSRVMGLNSLYGNEATAYVPAVVPVELLSFSSSVVDDDVTLNWATATEMNNSGFQIERKSPSPTPSLREGTFDDWESIGFVNGYGTTTEPQTYSFIDKNLSAGNYQYRLKQIDFDGTYEYSNTIEVEINPPTQFSLKQNYPNPFNPTTTIRFTIPSVETHLPAGRQGRDASLLTTLKVFDVLGDEITTLVNEEKPAGNYDVEFDASKHSSGIYYYQLKSGQFIQTKKMILMK